MSNVSTQISFRFLKEISGADLSKFIGLNDMDITRYSPKQIAEASGQTLDIHQDNETPDKYPANFPFARYYFVAHGQKIYYYCDDNHETYPYYDYKRGCYATCVNGKASHFNLFYSSSRDKYCYHVNSDIFYYFEEGEKKYFSGFSGIINCDIDHTY